MSEEETSSNLNVASGDAMGTRLVALESAVSNIQQSVQLLLSSRGPADFSLSNQGTATSSGTNLQATGFSMSSGQSVCSQTFAPSFLPVASVGLNQPNVNPTSSLSSQPTSNLAAAQSSGVPSLANWNIPKELFALNPQLFVTSQISEPGFSVAGVLPPVPGYIVNMVKNNIFVDFVLLRPANLNKLPPVEPVGAQLMRLLRCDKNSELLPIHTFQDWAEAWIVFASLYLQFHPDKVGQLMGYFLQISKIQRDSYSGGWLAYDRLFRKRVAENPSASWSDIDVNLFISNVFKTSTRSSVASSSMTIDQSTNICFFWNKGHCKFDPCRFQHVCFACKGSHRVDECFRVSQDSFQKKSRRRSPSPESPPRKKKSK